MACNWFCAIHDPGREGLRQAAIATSQSFAEFFIPSSEHDPVRSDQATTVDGVEAWRAYYSVTPDDPEALPASVSLIAIRASTPFYLVAIRSGDDAGLNGTVESVLASARIIPVKRR